MFRHESDNKEVLGVFIMHKDKEISIEAYHDWSDIVIS